MIERSEIIETISNNVRKAHLIVIGNLSMLRRVVRLMMNDLALEKSEGPLGVNLLVLNN